MEEDDLLDFDVDVASIDSRLRRLGTVRDVAAALTLRLSYFLANSSATETDEGETTMAVNAVERNWIANESFMSIL